MRLSGPRAPEVLVRMSGKNRSRWDSHRLYYGPIVHAEGQVLDQGLMVWMKAPHSFTGEEVVEFHLHGGHALAQLTLQSVLTQGVRLARPGEFTQRAFLNGKMDLTQAEAVAQLIQSRSRVAAEMAARNLQGLFSAQVERLRHQLLNWLAMLEAEIDFGDEVPSMPAEDSRRLVESSLAEIGRLLLQGQAGKLLSDGLRLVIVGAPNAGKSTLMNLLLGRQRALVTSVAGTTRDTLEEPLVVAGIPLLLVDTAGLRHSEVDLVERLGMEKARAEADQADLLLWVVDGHDEQPPELDFSDRPHLLLLNKADLGLAAWARQRQGVVCSFLQQDSAPLWKALEEEVRARVGQQPPGMRLTQRQWEALMMAQNSLQLVRQTIEAGLGPEFLALDLRAGVLALGQIQGMDVTEEILDRIFSTFCLGK